MREFRPLGNTLFPPVVKNLLIINGIMFLASSVFGQSLGINLEKHLALYYFTSPDFRIWQLVTHIFMHGSLGHLFSNMFALWMFGSFIENFLGPKKFLTYYIITGIGASILFTAVQFVEINPLQQHVEIYEAQPSLNNFKSFIENDVKQDYLPDFERVADYWSTHPNNDDAKRASVNITKEYLDLKINTPMVGASGAVFALLFAFGYLFPNMLVYIYFFIPMKAKYLVILYGAFELYNGIASNPGDNVAHFAHLGGMLIGFIMIKIWDIQRPGQFN
ncbi:MAG: rhomboid family intramembrane serine protease [Pelobium sp.]